MKRYHYFVSGMFDGRTGNGEAWSDGYPISRLTDIREIERGMARKTSYNEVTVTNYILMRVEKI
jgi:hypothetical protein